MRAPSIALASLLALLGCERLMGEEEPAPEPPRLVVTEPVVVDDAVDQITLLGDVHGEREVRVFAQAAERIEVLHVQEGDSVEEGDRLATLRSGIQSAGVSQASAAVDVAAAARDQLRVDVERLRGLVARGAAPRSQLETLEAQLRTSEAQLAQSRAARRSAGQQRDLTVVTAPVSGTVALLSVQQGDMVAPSVPICSVVQAERLRVHLRVTEQDYVRLRPGMAATLRPPALEGLTLDATVDRISPVLDPLTRTAQVELLVPAPDPRLRPGMVAEATIILETHAGTVIAPSRALVLSSRTDTEREASVFVFDREAGVARRRQVRLGRRYDSGVAIEDGLSGGEELVVQGQHLLRDGAPIRTREGDPASETS